VVVSPGGGSPGGGGAANTFVSVITYGAKGDGSTDDTTAFQNALATGQPVYVPPWKTNGYVVGNLILSNNSMFSDGGHLIFNGSATNFCIQFAPAAVAPSYVGATNTWGRSGLRGLEIDGGGGANIPSSFSTRHGVWVDPYGTNNFIENCYIHGFSGYGVLLASTKPFAVVAPFLSNQLPHVKISNVKSDQNFYGFYYASGRLPQLGGDSDSYEVFSTTATTLSCYSNAVGLFLQSGNSTFGNCDFSYNQTGVVLSDPAGASSHDTLTGCMLDHAVNYAVVGTNVANGIEFVACMDFSSPWYLTNCAGVVFESGMLDNTTLTITNGTANIFRNNHWVNAAPIFTFQNATNCYAYNNDPVNGSAFGTLPWQIIPTAMGTETISNLTALTLARPTTYGADSLTPASQGFPVALYENNAGTNLTTQFGGLTLVTAPSGHDAVYQIDSILQSTGSGTAGTMTLTYNYTDQFGTSQAIASGCGTVTLGSVGLPANGVCYLHAKKNTSVGITTSITGGGGGSCYALDVSLMEIR
jgi:hypothetical protein